MLTFAPPEDASPQIAPRRSPDAAQAVADERLDCLTRLARRHFGVSIALIARSDAERQWLGSCAGMPEGQIPGDPSFAGQDLLDDGILVVPDVRSDQRFHAHPLISEHPRMRFYAGCPLATSNGSNIGAFVLLDEHPRTLDDEQREYLRDLAQLAAASLENTGLVARLKAEADALRESERRMALAIAGSGTGIWDRNIPAQVIHYSPGWKAILGYADGEISNRIEDSYQRLHPDDLAYVQATMQAHFEGKTESYAVEHRIRCKDGRYKWISSRGKVVSRDSAGKPLRMIGTTTDITALRALSERLQQSVDLVTNLTNEVPGLVFQYRRLPSGESRFSYASAGIHDIYELSPAQVAFSDAAIEAIVHPEDLHAYRASLDSSAAGLTPWNLEYRVQLPRQGLRWRQGAARPQRLEDGSTLWHGFITDVTERKQIEAELLEFATIDFLTQLPNRRHFMQQTEAELARLQRSGGCAAVLMCDLDHFKSINDRWGHTAGDRALRHFATLLREQLRRSDIAGRVGGEEFAVVLGGADLAEAVTFARRLQQRLAQAPLLHGAQPIAMTLSIGIAVMFCSDTSVDAALSRSDLALYRAKESGRNRIECL